MFIRAPSATGILAAPRLQWVNRDKIGLSALASIALHWPDEDFVMTHPLLLATLRSDALACLTAVGSDSGYLMQKRRQLARR